MPLNSCASLIRYVLFSLFFSVMSKEMHMNSKALVCNSRVEVRCWCGARLLAFRRGIFQFSRIRFFDFFSKQAKTVLTTSTLSLSCLHNVTYNSIQPISLQTLIDKYIGHPHVVFIFTRSAYKVYNSIIRYTFSCCCCVLFIQIVFC